MTPDMRRLALAVAKVRWHDPAPSDDEWTDEALANFECEAIVRAVLIALKDLPFGHTQLSVGNGTTVGIPQITTQDIIGGWVDLILDTKARREAALSDLAQMDGELL